MRVRDLCSEAGERAGVADVGARCASTASTATSLTTSTVASTATATEFTTALTASTALATGRSIAASTTTLAAALATATTAASTTGSTLTRRGSEHAVTVELDVDLLLAGALALGLAAGASHVGLLLLGFESLALELLLGAFVGLADVRGSESALLLSLLSEVGSVRLALVFGLGLSGVLSSVGGSVLGLGLSDSLTGLLVSELSVAVVSSPSVSGLLLVVGNTGLAVTVVTATASSATSTATASTSATRGTGGFSRSSSAVSVRACTTIPESVVVAVAGLLAAALLAGPLLCGPGVRAVTLANPCYRLVNCFCRGIGGSGGIELWVVAQQLIHVLGSNGLGHLDGLKRLSRCALLDAQPAGWKERVRELALRI